MGFQPQKQADEVCGFIAYNFIVAIDQLSITALLGRRRRRWFRGTSDSLAGVWKPGKWLKGVVLLNDTPPI